jgi:outer membrane protein TolC
MFKYLLKILLVLSVGIVVSCAKRNPEPISSEDFLKSAEDDLAKIQEIKEQNDLFNKDLKIDLYTAIALAIENNKDLKVKLLETSLANRKIEDVEFEMLPTMAANAGYTGSDRYKTTSSATVPSNDLAGSIGSSYSTSRDRDVNEQDVGFSWNALDFGLSYIRAGQSSDKFLISKELEKKAANNITKDVIRAYWNALSAEKLIKKYDPLLIKVNNALNDSQKIEELLLQKPMDALLYQKELLDIQRALQSQKQSFINAKIELGALMGLLPNEKFVLVQTDQPLNELDMKLKHMEKHALVNRPELIENHYEERISIAETKAGMRSLLPGLNFNAAWTSSSNDYLMNKTNFEYGSSIGANLLNVFRAPKLKEVNEMNTEIIQEQRLALSMAVLSQVHISNIEYQMALEEYETADRYYDVSRKITEQVRNAQKIARFGELELIREEASLLVAELRRDIAFSKVQFSVAQVYTSVGVDVTTRESLQIGTKEFAEIIKKNFKDTGKNFKAIVKKPINKQKPVVTNDDLNISSFEFAKNTFKLDGKGRVQYSAKLSNNAPLPEWITFLPSQRTFLIDRKNKGNIEEIDLTVSARNINTATEDTFTLVVDPDLRKERLAKEKRIKEEKELAEKRKKEEKRLAEKRKKEKEKKLKAQKLKEKKAKLKAKKLAEKKAKELKTFDVTERVTTKDGNLFTFLNTEEINELIKDQEKKNKKLRKKLAKIKKKEEKERAKLEKKKKKKKKSKKEKVTEKVEPELETPKEMVKSIVSTDPENYLNVYLKAEEKNGSNYKLYSDEEIAKFIKKQEKKNKKLRKKLDKIKKKEAKKKAKKLKISKLN